MVVVYRPLSYKQRSELDDNYCDLKCGIEYPVLPFQWVRLIVSSTQLRLYNHRVPEIGGSDGNCLPLKLPNELDQKHRSGLIPVLSRIGYKASDDER